MRIDRFRPVSTAERQFAVLTLARAFLEVPDVNQRAEKVLV